MSNGDPSRQLWYAKPVAASIGATVTALTMTPFDVIKTRLQTQPSSLKSPSPSSSHPSTMNLRPSEIIHPCCRSPNQQCIRSVHSLALIRDPRSRGFFFQRSRVAAPQLVCLWDGQAYRNQYVTGFRDAAWRIWKTEGFPGLWKGVGTTLVVVVPAQTVYMFLYDRLVNSWLPQHDSAPFAAGIIARTAVSTVFSPLELLRTRLQSTPTDPAIPRTFASTLAGVGRMVRKEGLHSLWRGLSPTLWRDVPFSGMYWIGYENLRSCFKNRGHDGAVFAFFSGATSGVCAALLTAPFDTLKTRRQALIHDSIRSRTSILQFANEIVKTEGYRTLFAGLTPRLVKIAPACGIMIGCYEGVSEYLGQG